MSCKRCSTKSGFTEDRDANYTVPHVQPGSGTLRSLFLPELSEQHAPSFEAVAAQQQQQQQQEVYSPKEGSDGTFITMPKGPTTVPGTNSGSRKVVACFFGDYVPPLFVRSPEQQSGAAGKASGPSKGAKGTTRANSADAAAGDVPPNSSPSAPLEWYIHRTSILSTVPSPTSLVVVTECGDIDMFDLSSDKIGPYVRHRIPAPATEYATSLLQREGMPEEPKQGTTGTSSASTGGKKGLPHNISCASMIPAEIALRQLEDDVGNAFHLASAASTARQKNGGAPPVPKKDISDQDSTSSSSGPTRSDYARVVRQLWHGIVGTNCGEVFVFNGYEYILGFRCSSHSPLTQVHAVVLPIECQKGSNGTKPQQQQQQEEQHRRQQRSRNDKKRHADNNDLSEGLNEQVSLLCMNQAGQYSRVAFVTMQEDGSILCWRRNRSDRSLALPAVQIQVPSVLSKTKAMSILHTYLTPLTLSEWMPRYAWGVGDDTNLAAPVTEQLPNNASSTSNVNNNSSMSGGGSFGASFNSFTDDAKTALGSGKRRRRGGGDPAQQALAQFRNESHMYTYLSSVSGPEPLPFASLVVVGANGYSGEIFVRSVLGEKVEDDIKLDVKLKRTRVIAMDGEHALISRERIVYYVSYRRKEIFRVLTCRSQVTALALQRPIGVSGSRNGDINIFGSNTGHLLATSRTFNASLVRGLSFHYQAMLVAVTYATGEVELIQLPENTLRYGTIPNDKLTMTQTAVLRYSIAIQEGSAMRVSRRVLEELKLLAQMSMPGCVQQYLGPQQAML